MSCPLNSLGQPLCHITPHPDRPSESFCTHCRQRFHQGSGNWLGVAIGLLVTVLVISRFVEPAAPPNQATPTPIEQKVPASTLGL